MARIDEVTPKVLEFMKSAEGEQTTTKVANGIGESANLVREALKQLHSKGEIKHSGSRRTSVYFM